LTCSTSPRTTKAKGIKGIKGTKEIKGIKGTKGINSSFPPRGPGFNERPAGLLHKLGVNP